MSWTMKTWAAIVVQSAVRGSAAIGLALVDDRDAREHARRNRLPVSVTRMRTGMSPSRVQWADQVDLAGKHATAASKLSSAPGHGQLGEFALRR
jgi:hypothetical protein